jgi:hypothetical protein
LKILEIKEPPIPKKLNNLNLEYISSTYGDFKPIKESMVLIKEASKNCGPI